MFRNSLKIAGIFFCVITAQLACGQDAEKEAIKRVVMLETESYLGVDLETWKTTWMPVPYAYWSFSDKEGTQFIDGWDNILKEFDGYFKNQKPSRSTLSYVWLEIRVYTNGAYVRFLERSADNANVEETNQIRVLEKKDGKWKVVCMSAVVK